MTKNWPLNALFISCILKVNNTLIDNTEDLDIVMPMYNLTEYSKSFSKASGSLWSYYRDEPNSMVGNMNYSVSNSKYFDYKTSITGRLEGTDTEKKCWNFCTAKVFKQVLENVSILLINCEVSLTFTWSANCVITNKKYRGADPNADTALAQINVSTNTVFSITHTKLHVPVVTAIKNRI